MELFPSSSSFPNVAPLPIPLEPPISASRRRRVRGLAWLLLSLWSLGALTAHSQDTEASNPTGPSGTFNGEVATGGGYDPFTGNYKRSVVDLTVPGCNGAYPLAFGRTYNSQRYVVASDRPILGDGGNWRHSYQWTLATVANNVFSVAYPDGAVVTFKAGRNFTPTTEFSNYLHGPSGTADRLEMVSPSVLYLHTSDGGIVAFENSVWPTYIQDPNGARTIFTYNGNTGYLTQVTEPGGRWLKFFYVTVKQTYRDINTNNHTISWVQLSQVQASTGQTVNYTLVQFGSHTISEETTGAGTVNYYVLTDVNYGVEDVASNTAVHATYSYVNPDGNPPILVTASDPHYAGAMKQIRYAGNDLYGGTSFEEQNFSTGERVSHLERTVDSTATTISSTETRGDVAAANGGAITRTFSYVPPPPPPGEAEASKASLLYAVTDFEGRNSQNEYYTKKDKDTNGKSFLLASSDAQNNTTFYEHEPLTGKITKVTLPDGRSRSSVWSNQGGTDARFPYYLQQTTDERGNSTYYRRYSNTGLVYQVEYPDGGVERYDYVGFTVNGATYYKVAHNYTRLGATITYNYGNNGGSGRGDLLVSVTRAYNEPPAPGSGGPGAAHSETTTFHYDPLDRVDQTTDPRGVSDVFAYNGRHQVTRVTHVSDAYNPHTHVDTAYDDWGRATSVADELGHVTTTSYDEYSRPLSVTVPVNAGGITTRTTRFTYERRNNSNAVVSTARSHTSGAYSYAMLPSGRATQHLYSPNGWLTDEYQGQSNGDINNPYFPTCLLTRHNVGYDYAGRVLSVTDAQGHVWGSHYDRCGRPDSTTDPLGHVTTTAYYPALQNNGQKHPCAGFVQSVTTPGNNYATTLTTAYTAYDAMGRCTGWADPQNNAFGSGYDPAGHLVSQSDGMSPTSHPATRYGYDTLGRKGRIDYADGTFERWKYDASGNVASYRNRRANTQTYNTYDGRNRPTGFQWDDGSTGAGGVTGLAFDAAGRCTFQSNGYCRLDLAYDDSGALLSERQSIGGGTGGPTVGYRPDADGRVAKVIYPNGDSATWDYDFLGRITEAYVSVPGLNVSNQPLVGYAYNPGQTLLGSRVTCAGVVTAYLYRADDRVSVVQQYVAGGPNISHRTYGYYPDGQLSWFNKTADGSANTLEDDRGDAYYYHPNGELYFVHHEAQGVHAAGSASNVAPTGDSWSDNPVNGWRVNAYEYDAAGNRTSANESGQISQPTFDGENRHVSYGFDASGNVTTGVANQGIWNYTYDAYGQLLTATPYGATAPTARFVYDPRGRLCQRTVGGVTTNLYYAGDELIEEDDAGSGARRGSYVYGAGGERADRLGADYASTFYHYDARGFVTHLSDGGGHVVEQYLYDAFGQPYVYDAGSGYRGQGSAINNNRTVWAGGYEWYPELGLYRCGARFYDPTCAHWLQPDPIGQAGGLNLYAYCHNDPINLTDPTGLAEEGVNGESSHVRLSRDGVLPDGQSVHMDGPMSDENSIAGYDSKGTLNVISGGRAAQIEAQMHGVGVYAGGGEANLTGIGAPGFWGSMIPFYGNGRSAINAFQTGHPWQGAFYSAMAVSDVFLVKSLVTAAAKGVVMAGTKVMAREALAETGCFTAGTVVYTERGNVPIEQVKGGDWVLAQVEGTDYQEWKQVLATSVRTVHDLVILAVADERIETTLEHPFWVEGRGWTPAGQLCVGDQLLDREGARLSIQGVEIRAGERTVYNFVVADDHDYFVGQHHLLVHNGLCSAAVNTVYRAVDDAGKTVYVGITNNLERRAAEHLTEKGIRIRAIDGLTNLTRADARAAEQVLIEGHGLGREGGTLLNQINSISTSNPIYDQAIERGTQLLEQIGYDGF